MPSAGVFEALEPLDVLGDKMEQPLPLGPEGLLHGKLENGLTYYVRKCPKPKERVAIAVAVKIGSVVEADKEQGVAHILEHLAFNATEHYSNHEIVKFLERIGAEFGACQNAYTSADETVYQLMVPSDKPELLDESIGVLAEFAFGIRCHAGDLKKERGAVMEEWRMNRDARGRASEAHWKLIMEGSKYADRLPIGKESVIRGVPAEVVRAFFERWYRPELMAVAVVGDLEPEHVHGLIVKHMAQGRSRAPAPAPPVPTYSFAPHKEPRCKVRVDKETQESSVYVSFKIPRLDVMTPQQYLDQLHDLVFESTLASRLFKLSRETDPSFVSADVAQEPLTTTVSSNTLTAIAMEGSKAALRALESLLTEVARVRLYGFHQKEIDRTIRIFKADVESTYLERDQGYCFDVRDEYLRHFLNKEFVTGQEIEARLSKTLLPLVTKAGVEARAAAYHPSCSCVIKVVEHRQHCTDEEVREVVHKVMELERQGLIPPWTDGDVPDCLIPPDALPEPGAVVSERQYGGPLQATELVLSNGMRVCFKCTDFMDDEVLLTGFAFGGLSEVPPEIFGTARMANTIAGQLGVCGFKPSVLLDILAGKRVQADISEGAYHRFMKGVQSPTDLEEAFQLVHLLFKTNVVLDEAEVSVIMRIMRQNVEAQLRNPTFRYSNRVREINYGSCYYFVPTTLEDLDKVDAQLACALHNMSYRNPAEFTLVLTGKLDREVLLPLVLRYLASIPATPLPPPKTLPEVKPLPVVYPDAPIVEDVKVPMVSPITQTQITFPVVLDRPTAREQLVMLSLACRVLETRLLQRMRFKWGEIYTVTVSSFFGCEAPSNTGDPRGDVAISFTCDPANRAKLREMALEEVEALQASGPTEEELTTIKNLERLQFEEQQQENSYWHEIMVTGYQSKTFHAVQDLIQVYEKNLAARDKVLSSLSPDSMRDSMRVLFPYPCRSKYTSVSMVPQQPWLGARVVAGVGQAFWGVASWLGVQGPSVAGEEVYYEEEVGTAGVLFGEGEEVAGVAGAAAAAMGGRSPSRQRQRSISVAGAAGLQRACSTCSDGGQHAHAARGARHGAGSGFGGGGAGLVVMGAAAVASAVALVGLRAWYTQRGGGTKQQ